MSGILEDWRGEESRDHFPARVLVIESAPERAERIVEVLDSITPHCPEITYAESRNAAFDLMAGHEYDIIMLGFVLRDGRGDELVRSVAAQSPNSAVVVIAGAADLAQAWPALAHGAKAVLPEDQICSQSLVPLLRQVLQQCDLERTVERYSAELELTNGRFLSLVVDNADAMIVVDRVGVIRFVNPSAERILNRPAADLLGQMFGIPLEDGVNTEIEIVAGAQPRTAETRVMRTFWDGARAHLVTMRDVTERKQVEREMRIARQTAEQANKLKSQFLANMSHELRTPLNSIIGFSEMMQLGLNGETLPPKCAEYASIIHGSGSHLLSLISDLLDLSKAEQGCLDLHDEKFDIVALFRSLTDMIHPQARQKRIDLALHTYADSIWVLGDQRLLKQALLNLLSNALKFTEIDGAVSLAIERTMIGEIKLVVSDNGCGMDRSDVPRAFATFVQLDNAYQREDLQGTGLGLALTKEFIELHGGKIKMNSDVGVGTTVIITLPVSRSIGHTAESNVVNLQDRINRPRN